MRGDRAVVGRAIPASQGFGTWLGASLATVGMYFLSVNEHFSMLYGDWYQLAGAVVISAQMMLVGRFALRHRRTPR